MSTLSTGAAGTDATLQPVLRATYDMPAEAAAPGAPAVPAVPVVPRRQGRHLKTAFDLVVAGSLIVLLAPVLLLLALLVRCTSRGPVLFRQTRIGLEGRPFTILKFRSMRVGAEREVDALRTLNEAGGPLFKIRRDPRLTPVGRWMRRLSLDELPQLFNVLSGSMSLVGPRPALPEEVAAFTPGERGRLAVKPGLTGLAQVSGRSDLPWPEVVALDLVYVAGRTLRTDLRILARTVPAVLTGRGAY